METLMKTEKAANMCSSTVASGKKEHDRRVQVWAVDVDWISSTALSGSMDRVADGNLVCAKHPKWTMDLMLIHCSHFSVHALVSD